MLAGAPPPSAWSSPAPRRVPRLYVTTAIPSIISMVMLMPGVWLMPAQFFMFMLMPGVWLMPAQFYGHGHAHACHLFTTLMPARLLMFMPAVEVHACTDITGHVHACCLSTTLLPVRMSMFMPAVEFHACTEIFDYVHACGLFTSTDAHDHAVPTKSTLA